MTDLPRQAWLQYEALLAPRPAPFDFDQIVDRFYDRFFEHQVACIAEAGLSSAAALEPWRAVLPRDGKLFLVVPPKPRLGSTDDLKTLIAKLSFAGREGALFHVDLQDLVDEVGVPTRPYILTQMDDGRSMLNESVAYARERLRAANRWPLTWFEGFLLHLCFGELLYIHHSVLCSGSRCGSEHVPGFRLADDQPMFGKVSKAPGHSPQGWGTASCKRRVES